MSLLLINESPIRLVMQTSLDMHKNFEEELSDCRMILNKDKTALLYMEMDSILYLWFSVKSHQNRFLWGKFLKISINELGQF